MTPLSREMWITILLQSNKCKWWKEKKTVQLNTFIVLNEIQDVQSSFQVMVLYSSHEWSVATSITIFKL